MESRSLQRSRKSQEATTAPASCTCQSRCPEPMWPCMQNTSKRFTPCTLNTHFEHSSSHLLRDFWHFNHLTEDIRLSPGLCLSSLPAQFSISCSELDGWFVGAHNLTTPWQASPDQALQPQPVQEPVIQPEPLPGLQGPDPLPLAELQEPGSQPAEAERTPAWLWQHSSSPQPLTCRGQRWVSWAAALQRAQAEALPAFIHCIAARLLEAMT